MQKSSLAFRAGLCFALSFLLLSPAFSQSDTAQISGFVRDPSGLGIPGAGVTVTNETTQLERKAVTNDQGYYVVASLSPGYYTIAVEMEGFKKFVKTRNKLDAERQPENRRPNGYRDGG